MDNPTPAVVAAEAAGISFEVVRTVPARDAAESARLQGIELNRLVRTIVVRRAADDYLFLLVPGGRAIDWAKLRAHLGVKRLSLPDAEEARRVTGYERGAITPLGSTGLWPVIADATLPGSGSVAIGGGARGVNLHVDPLALLVAIDAEVADVTMPEEERPRAG